MITGLVDNKKWKKRDKLEKKKNVKECIKESENRRKSESKN